MFGNWPRDGAFTFIEVLAALLFLGILVPAVVSGLVLSNRLSVFSERNAAAEELAQNKLNELLIDDAWESTSDTRGDFGTDWPGYRWEMEQENWAGDTVNTMTELTMRVFFNVQGHEHSVRLTTLVSDFDEQTPAAAAATQSSPATPTAAATPKTTPKPKATPTPAPATQGNPRAPGGSRGQ